MKSRKRSRGCSQGLTCRPCSPPWGGWHQSSCPEVWPIQLSIPPQSSHSWCTPSSSATGQHRMTEGFYSPYLLFSLSNAFHRLLHIDVENTIWITQTTPLLMLLNVTVYCCDPPTVCALTLWCWPWRGRITSCVSSAYSSSPTSQRPSLVPVSRPLSGKKEPTLTLPLAKIRVLIIKKLYCGFQQVILF